jgi:parallel beta-helix repeat protein
MKNCLSLLLLAVFLSLNYSLFPCPVDTVCGFYTGHTVWDADTVKVTCDVTCDTLTIMPGVVVEFQGYYSILADSIYAVGTKTDSILFTINDTTGIHDLFTTDGGWAFVESGFFGSCDEIIKHKFEYCIFEYGKQVFDHEYKHFCHGGTVLVERCTYRYNYIKDHLIYYGARNCNFIGNNCGSISGAVESYFLFDSCTIEYNTLNGCIPEHSGSANIENCNIHHNKGCGIGADDVIVKNSLIHHNELSIGARNCISVYNNIINHNKAVSVIHTGEGCLTVVNNIIHDNEGTAIRASTDSYIDIINNQIFNNKGDGIKLGFTMLKRPSTVTNNLIYNNDGSGISFYESSGVIISNNTIVNNKADYGGGIKLDISEVQMYNNIVRNNGINNIGFVVTDKGMSSLSIQNCNIEGLNDFEGANFFNNNGINNSFDFDPYFIDTSSFDFRLSDSSLCINAGIINPAEFNISEFDLDGNPRIYDGLDKRIDIGAYEFQGEPRGRAPLLTPTSDQYLLKSSIEELQVWYIGNDPDELHTLSIASSDSNVIISELSGNNPGSTYFLIPKEGWEGNSTVIVKIEDGQGYFDIDTFMVYVGNVQCGIIKNDRVWNLDTIIVACDVLVDENAQLTVNPGTVILFEDYTVLEIFGKIEAIGTNSDRILFTAKDTSGFYNNTFEGWKGIKFRKYGESSNSRLSDCIVEYCNSTPGALSIEDEHIVISKSIIRNNNLKGSNTGAISITGANNTLAGNIIYNNRARDGGGVYLRNTNLVINNFITNNISIGYAAGICNIGNSLIVNNIISNNSCTGFGSGGFYTNVGTTILLNNTITNNYSNNNGGGLYLNGNSVIKNCIIWNNQSKNSGNQIFMESMFHEFSIEYCLIRNGENDIVSDEDFSLSGTNKVTDPIFIAPSSGVGVDYNGLEADWSLSSESPCINSGTIDTTGLNLPPYDIEGYPRVFHGRIDIGAYEFISDTIAIVEQPENSIACYGDSVSLKIDGIDLFAIQWQKNEINIPNANKKELKINPVTLEDEGKYKCIVSNIVDTMFSQTATVTVHEEPQIISNEADIDVCEREDTVILVQAYGSSPFTYQWYKNNAILGGYTDSVLVLSPVTNDDEAIYKYVIINHCGGDSVNFRVYVNPLPAVDLGQDILLNEGYSTVLDAGEWSSYLWNDNSTERFLEVSQQGTYWTEVMDENGCKNRDTVSVTINPVENINDAYSEPNIMLYPVPFDEKMIISFPGTVRIYTIKIIDITGNVIRIMNPISKTPVELYRGDISPGVYLLELTTDKGIWMSKVVVE